MMGAIVSAIFKLCPQPDRMSSHAQGIDHAKDNIVGARENRLAPRQGGKGNSAECRVEISGWNADELEGSAIGVRTSAPQNRPERTFGSAGEPTVQPIPAWMIAS